MSETPLTDAAELKCRDVNGGVYGMVDADDMAKLERKCTSLQSALVEAERDVEQMCRWVRGSILEHNAKKSCECGYAFDASLQLIADKLAAHEARVNPKGAAK